MRGDSSWESGEVDWRAPLPGLLTEACCWKNLRGQHSKTFLPFFSWSPGPAASCWAGVLTCFLILHFLQCTAHIKIRGRGSDYFLCLLWQILGNMKSGIFSLVHSYCFFFFSCRNSKDLLVELEDYVILSEFLAKLMYILCLSPSVWLIIVHTVSTSIKDICWDHK